MVAVGVAMMQERDNEIELRAVLQREIHKLEQQLAEMTAEHRRVQALEESIREVCGLELNCLSHMNISFVEKAVKWYQQQLATVTQENADIKAQLATARRDVWEEAAKALNTVNVNNPDSFTAMAFNDACRDLRDWCREQATKETP